MRQHQPSLLRREFHRSASSCTRLETYIYCRCAVDNREVVTSALPHCENNFEGEKIVQALPSHISDDGFVLIHPRDALWRGNKRQSTTSLPTFDWIDGREKEVCFPPFSLPSTVSTTGGRPHQPSMPTCRSRTEASSSQMVPTAAAADRWLFFLYMYRYSLRWPSVCSRSCCRLWRSLWECGTAGYCGSEKIIIIRRKRLTVARWKNFLVFSGTS